MFWMTLTLVNGHINWHVIWLNDPVCITGSWMILLGSGWTCWWMNCYLEWLNDFCSGTYDSVKWMNDSGMTWLLKNYLWKSWIYRLTLQNGWMTFGLTDVTVLTINVPLFKKLRNIIFFMRDNHFFLAISRDILRGPRLFWPLKFSCTHLEWLNVTVYKWNDCTQR